MDVAIDIWNDLKTRYSQGDLSCISDLQLEVASLSQGDLCVTDYFTKLRIIWDELDNFRPNPLCTCSVKCSCSVQTVMTQRKCEDRAMHFLRGLNDQYSNIRSHVLLMDPIPPFPKIFSLAVQQERQLSTILPLPSPHSTNVSRTTSSNPLLCDFCGKLGHSETVCFRKVRFPTTDVRNTRVYSGGKFCTYCNKVGHTIDTFYKKHGFSPRYKVQNFTRHTQIHNLITTDDLFIDNISKEQDVKDFQLTSQQCQFLNDLLRHNITAATTAQAQVNQLGTFSVDTNNPNNQSPVGNTLSFTPTIHNFWIIDSGATDHVFTNLSVFTHYTKISPVLINLLNGHTVFHTTLD